MVRLLVACVAAASLILVPAVTTASAATSTPDATTCPPVFPGGQASFGIAEGNGPNAYWLFDERGDIAAEGTAACVGSLAGSAAREFLQGPIVGMSAIADGSGYWLAGFDGGVFNYGNAKLLGSMGGKHLNQPIIGMAARHDGKGYWLVATDGGVFSFGAAHFYGSTGNIALNAPIVGMATTPDDGGYWLVAADGGIFAFGDAPFFGSAGNIALAQKVVGMAARPDGRGYWLVAADGGIFNYGAAAFLGSAVGKPFRGFAVGVAPTPDNHGYRVATVDGNVFPFGTAQVHTGVFIVPYCRGAQVTISQPAGGAPQGAAGTQFASFDIAYTAAGPLCSIDGSVRVAGIENNRIVPNLATFPAYGPQPVYLAHGDVAHFTIHTNTVNSGGCTATTGSMAMALPRDNVIEVVPTGPFRICADIQSDPVAPGALH